MADDHWRYVGNEVKITINLTPTLTQEDVREAVGLESANLDTQFSDVLTAISQLDYPGDGSIPVDQDYGGKGNLTYTVNGKPVGGAWGRAYLKSDYDAQRRSDEYVQATTTQLASGDWSNPMLLDPGVYKLLFYLRNVAGPDLFDLVVTE